MSRSRSGNAAAGPQAGIAAPKAGTVETNRHGQTPKGHEKHVGYTPTSEWLPLSREALLTITGVVVGGLQVSTVNEALTLAAVRTETLKVHTHTMATAVNQLKIKEYIQLGNC